MEGLLQRRDSTWFFLISLSGLLWMDYGVNKHDLEKKEKGIERDREKLLLLETNWRENRWAGIISPAAMSSPC